MLPRTVTLALVTLAAVCCAVAPAQAGMDDKGKPSADPAEMAITIREQLQDNAFGWQFAIARNGKLAAKDADGSARSDADTPQIGGDLAMTPSTRYEIASVTKNITAVATVKLLRELGLTIDARVDPWLPPAWKRGYGFARGAVRFRHLLSHQSGIHQRLVALGDKRRSGLGWEAMQQIVEVGTYAGLARRFSNANYALLGIANAYMWKKLGGRVGGKAPAIDKATRPAYSLDHMRRTIFEPAGLKGVSCEPGDAATSGLGYPAGATQGTHGQPMIKPKEDCAGADGIRLNAVELVRYLAHLRHGAIIDPADLKRKDALLLGWDENSNGSDAEYDDDPDKPLSPGAFWHAGRYISHGAELRTCAMTFSDGLEASIIVNSPLEEGDQCDVLLEAWTEAR